MAIILDFIVLLNWYVQTTKMTSFVIMEINFLNFSLFSFWWNSSCFSFSGNSIIFSWIVSVWFRIRFSQRINPIRANQSLHILVHFVNKQLSLCKKFKKSSIFSFCKMEALKYKELIYQMTKYFKKLRFAFCVLDFPRRNNKWI